MSIGFSGQVLRTLAVRVGLVGLGFVHAVVLARWLGPDGRGVFSTLSVLIGVAGMVGSLGLPAAMSRWAAAEPGRVPALAANARLTAMGVGLLLWALLSALGRWVPHLAGEVPPGLIALAALALPFSLASTQFQAILLGQHRIRAYSYLDAAERVFLVAASAALLVAFGGGVRELVLVTVLIAAGRALGTQLLLGRPSIRSAPDPALLREMMAFAGRSYLTTLCLYLAQRCDVLVINRVLGAERTGVYSVAVQLVELLVLLPAAAAVVLLPRVAAEADGGGAAFTAKVVRHALWVELFAALLLGVATTLFAELIFGPGYADVVGCVWILLPGVLCLALQLILFQDLAGRDHPGILALVWLSSVVLNVGLNLWLLPRLGIRAAALSSTVCYVLSAVLLGRYWLRRFPEVGPLQMAWLPAEERRVAWQRLRGLLRPLERAPTHQGR